MTEDTGQGWTVTRHGGRSIDHWRVVIIGDEQTARKAYEKARLDMRQGGVRLNDPDGNIVLDSWAPRLRTRW